MPLPLLILGSVLIVSIASLVGIVLLAIGEMKIKRILLCLVSFSTGALLATVLLHFLPEMMHICTNISRAAWLILASILFSFVLERFMHWRHCHLLENDCRIHPVGPMMLIGDGIHNVLDGILIATSYLISVPLGMTTTLAVILHEIPQEIGDFAVLLHSGYSKRQALFFNFLSALTAVIGALFVLMLNVNIHGIETILLPIAAGNFLYIATADLIPELHKETNFRRAAVQFLFLIAGAGLLAFLSLFGPQHEHFHEEEHKPFETVRSLE